MTDERIEAQDRAARALFVAAAFWLGPVGPAQPVAKVLTGADNVATVKP